MEVADSFLERAERKHARFECLASVLELYREASKLAPDDAEIWACCAYINMYRRHDKVALEDIDKALHLNPMCLLALYVKATVLFDMTVSLFTERGLYTNADDAGRRRGAEAALRTAESSFARCVSSYNMTMLGPKVLLARLYALRRLRPRTESLNFLSVLSSVWSWPHMRIWLDIAIVNTYLAYEMNTKANDIQAASAVRIAKCPLAQAWLLYNQTLADESSATLTNFKRAFALFSQTEHGPECEHAVDYILRISQHLCESDERPSAIELLSEGIRNYPRSASLRHERGLVHSELHNADDAIGDLTAARDLEPNSLLRCNAVIAVLGDCGRFMDMWQAIEFAVPLHNGIARSGDICFLNMVVMAATVSVRPHEGVLAANRLLQLRSLLDDTAVRQMYEMRMRLFHSCFPNIFEQEHVVVPHLRVLDFETALGLLTRDNVNVPVSPDGSTALFVFIQRSAELSLIRRLLELGADVNYLNAMARSPLFYAVHSVPMVELLLSFGAELELRDRDERVPLSYVDGEPSAHGRIIRQAASRGAATFATKTLRFTEFVDRSLKLAGLSLDRFTLALLMSFVKPTNSDIVIFDRQLATDSAR